MSKSYNVPFQMKDGSEINVKVNLNLEKLHAPQKGKTDIGGSTGPGFYQNIAVKLSEGFEDNKDKILTINKNPISQFVCFDKWGEEDLNAIICHDTLQNEMGIDPNQTYSARVDLDPAGVTLEFEDSII